MWCYWWRLLGLLLGFMEFAWTAVPTINVYNWSGYLPESVLKAFTQETGIRVNYSTYDSNETLYAKLKANPRSGYDIVVPSGYFVHRMIREGMLRPIDKNRLPHFKNLDPLFLNKPYDSENQYSVPYLWSSTGLLVNSHYYDSKGLNHWAGLWDSRFKGQLLLLDDVREVFSMALLSSGYSPNTRDPDQIKQAYLKLKQLMSNVKLFGAEGVQSLYVDEDLVVGMVWNGDAYRIQQENPAVQFYYPEEGYILSIDNLVIPIGARHIEQAYQFIDFLLRPDIAAQISLKTGYASPNRAARKHLPEAILSNPIIYPEPAILRKGITQLDVDAQVNLYEHYWERLKIEG